MMYFINFKKKGFSLIELLTVVAIIGVLSAVGITSFKKQINRSRTAEAKNSLSFILRSEKQFKSEWKMYHENLVLVGAVIEEELNYDAGFKALSSDIAAIPDFPSLTTGLPALIKKIECITWSDICKKLCVATGLLKTTYFTCTINSKLLVKNVTGGSYKANAGTFKAIASDKLKDDDVWSINQLGTLEHVKDGT